MTEQEIKAKADKAVEVFMDVTPLDISLNDSVESVSQKLIQDRKVATQCAIIMYEDRVNTYLSNVESIKLFEAIPLSFSRQSYIDQAILTELKSRL